MATGLMVGEAVKAAKALEADGIDARVINIHTIKPIDRELIAKAAKETGRIVTVEEHNIIGGLGEAVSAVVCEECPVPVTRIGVNDVFGHSGPAVDLLKEFGLCADHAVIMLDRIQIDFCPDAVFVRFHFSSSPMFLCFLPGRHPDGQHTAAVRIQLGIGRLHVLFREPHLFFDRAVLILALIPQHEKICA